MKKRTLRTILNRLTLISMIMITLFGILFYRLTDMLSQNRSLEYFEGLSAKAEQSVSAYLNELQRTASLAAYSRSVQVFLFESNTYSRAEAQRAATDLLSSIISFSPGLCEIAFVNLKGNLIQSTGEHAAFLQAVVKEQGFSPQKLGKESFFSKVIYNTSSPTDRHTPYFLYVSPVYSLIEGDFSAYPAATCLMLLKLENLTNLLMEGLSVQNARIILTEGDDMVFTSSHLEDEATLSEIPYGGSQIKFNGVTSLTYRRKLEGTLWSVDIIAPEAVFSRDLIPIKKVIFLFLLTCMLVQTLMLVAGTRQLTSPLKQLLRRIQEIDLTRESNTRIGPVQVEEMGLLADSINDMLDKIEEMEQNQKETQRALYQTSLLKNQAQLQYYRSQINPHFLYNTLECISSMARVYKVPYIESICTSMADLFRYSISDASVVSLSQELAHAENYFNIISQRASNRYSLKVSVPGECREMRMQKMVLQPLLENSIKHGFEEKDGPCRLLIRASAEDNGETCILVADNGLGIPPAKAAELNQQLQEYLDEPAQHAEAYAGVGLINISQRLKLEYKGRSRMELQSRYGYYTCVKIWLPPEGKETKE